jgi:hypothetical protein
MKQILFILIVGFGFGARVNGQGIISGTVTDAKNGQPVLFANIVTRPGMNGTITDSLGKFSLAVATFPVTIRISHIAYKPFDLTVTKTLRNLQIRLEPVTENIGEVVIQGGKYQQLLRKENFYVSRFEFDGDKIWVTGFAGKSILKPGIILLNLNGSLLDRQPLSTTSGLFKDAFGQVYLIDRESLTPLACQDGKIEMGKPKKFGGWEQNLFELQLVLGKSGIFKWEYNAGIYIEYAAVDFRDTIFTVIHKSYDRSLFRGEEYARTFRHSPIPDIKFPVWGTGLTSDPSDAFTARAQEQVDYRPVVTHIFRYRNNYLIFEDRGGHLWKYDVGFVDPVDLRLTVPENAQNTDMYQDPVTGDLYLYYNSSGSDYLAHINPDNGSTQVIQKLENFSGADNIRIYNDKIWFTHQNRIGSMLMNLYSTAVKR